MAPDARRPRPQTALLLGWGIGALLMACLLTLWVTFSLVTYNVGGRKSTYFLISLLGASAVGLCLAAVRQFFRSPGDGSDEQRLGMRLLVGGAVATVIGALWLLIL